MSINTKSIPSNGQYKKTHHSAVGIIFAVLMIINKVEVTGGTTNDTVMMPAAAVNNAAGYHALAQHLEILPNKNWDNDNDIMGNLGAQKDSSAVKNAKGITFLAKHFGVSPKVSQEHLAKLQAEEEGMQSAEEADSKTVDNPQQQGTATRRIKSAGETETGAVDYSQEGTEARRIKSAPQQGTAPRRIRQLLGFRHTIIGQPTWSPRIKKKKKTRQKTQRFFSLLK